MIFMNEGLETLQEQIKKLTHMVEENNAMLQSIQRRARMVILISSIKWIFIIGVTFSSLFFLQPYLDKAFSAYDSISQLSNPFPKDGEANSENATPTDGNTSESFMNAIRSYLPR
jgi:hypothetical protein